MRAEDDFQSPAGLGADAPSGVLGLVYDAALDPALWPKRTHLAKPNCSSL